MLDVLRIATVSALILYLLWKKWNLGLVMLLGSILLGVVFLLPLKQILLIVLKTSVECSTLELVAVLILISILEKLLSQSNATRRMALLLSHLLRNKRILLPVMPAILGLLPSPGGAMFSAPLVEETSRGCGLSAEVKTFINYWFRHCWEYIFPLYPSVILAGVLLHISFSEIFLAQWYFTAVVLVVGYMAGLRSIQPACALPQPASNRPLIFFRLLLELMPILVVLVSVLGFRLNLALVLLAVVVVEILASPLTWNERLSAIRSAFTPNTVFLIIGVFVFRDMLKASGAVAILSEEMVNLGMPSLILFSSLPFMVGILTGVTQAAIGIAYPLLLGLVPDSPDLRLFACAYACGFAGVLLSPTHLCLVLTVEYFQANLKKVYRMLLLPVCVLILTAFLLAMF